jgi:ribonuclease R
VAIDTEQILRLVNTAGRLVGLQELLRAGGFNPGEQTALKRVLRELVRQGKLVRDGKRFGPIEEAKPKGKPQKSGPAWGGKKPGEVRATFGVKEKAAPPLKTPLKKRAPVPVEIEEEETPAPKKGPPRTRSTAPNTVVGIIHHHRDGFAFVKPIVGQVSEDLFIPPDEARKALDNDQVVVEVLPGRDGRTMGRVVSVQSRTRQQVIGTYFENARQAWVEPRERELGNIRVPKTQLARPGDVVKVRLGVGDSMFAGPAQLTGEVSGSMGSDADHSVEVLSVAFSKGFSDEFPPEVMDEADAISIEVSEAQARGEKRRDLRTMPLITIDGEDARDFDDAVYCEEHPRGFRLVVAIADVSHYVQEGTALDAEALRRATSVYLPSRVLPMLPERLSNGICSLKPDVDRLCMVADMVIDKTGITLESEVYPGVMRSAARCTYTEVHDVLAGNDVPGRTELKPMFDRLYTLSKTLTAMRLARGAIDFDLPEQKVELGEDGLPVRLVRRERWESHRLVEECMLAANEAVARFFREQNLPTVNRYHGDPDEERLDMFLTLLGAYGIEVPHGEFTSKSLNEVLKQLEGHPEQRALNQLALRSMMQAVYSSKNTGHYGLGAEDYLHFTSPIRRYPDLLVHRLLKELWKRGKKRLSDDQLEAEEERLEALSVQCSERERAAMQVEREVNQLYSCLLLKDRIGEEHDATVAGLSDNGFYVQLDELFVEGFVKGETVYPDFEFDQSTYRMTFGNGLVVKVGAKCRVMILSVNMDRKQIDFQVQELAGEEIDAHEAAERPQRGSRYGGAPKRGGGRQEQSRGGGRFGGEKKKSFGGGRGDRPYRSQDKGGRFGPPAERGGERGDGQYNQKPSFSGKPVRGGFAGKSDRLAGGAKSDRFGGAKSDRFGGAKSDRFGGAKSDRFGGAKSDRFGGAKSDRFGGKSEGFGSSAGTPKSSRYSGARNDDAATTSRFGKMEPRATAPDRPSRRLEASKPSRFSGGERPSRFGRGEQDRRREPPPPQPWEKKKDEAEPEERTPTRTPGGFDARAVLDRLWRERGGGGGRKR